MKVFKNLLFLTLFLAIAFSSFFLVGRAAATVAPSPSTVYHVSGKAISYSDLNLGGNDLFGNVAISINLVGPDDKPTDSLCSMTSSNDDNAKGIFSCDFSLDKAGSKIMLTATHSTAEKYSVTIVAKDKDISFYPRLKLSSIPQTLCLNKATKILGLDTKATDPVGINQFWICGNAAKAMWNDTKTYKDAWATIATEIIALRNDYAKQSGTPPEIIIDSESPDEAKSNAAYSYAGTDLRGCWPQPTTDKFADEPYMVIHAGTIREVASDKSYLKSVTDHEFAHLKDWKDGGCTKYSSIVPGSTLDSILQRWKKESVANDNPAYKAINESDYTLGKIEADGHPWDNNMEAYASSFAVERNTPDALQKNIDSLKNSASPSDREHGLDIEKIVKFVTSGAKQ